MKPMLTDAASVEKVVQAMTLQEKARMVIGGSPFHTEAMPEYSIPAMYIHCHNRAGRRKRTHPPGRSGESAPRSSAAR